MMGPGHWGPTPGTLPGLWYRVGNARWFAQSMRLDEDSWLAMISPWRLRMIHLRLRDNSNIEASPCPYPSQRRLQSIDFIRHLAP